MANKVEICGVNTAKLPVYKDAEMQEMLRAIKEGDEQVREKFITGNLRLVLSVIQRFNNRGENPDDLFQVGCIGLIKALDNFDLSHGVKFSTYAVPMIIGEVRRYLRDNNSIRDVVLALDSIQEPVSLYEPVFHDDGDAIFVMDQVQDTKNTDERWIENISLSEAMNKLTARERHILQMRFFEGKTQMEVAEEISISQAQVSRLEKNALKYMRKYV